MDQGGQRGASLTAEALNQLRQRLLDLTARNRLLNFRHPSKRSLRVIDELPDQLAASLLSGNEMRFKAVPEPSEDQLLRAGYLKRDEQTGEVIKLRNNPSAREWADHLGLVTSYEVPLVSESEGAGRHQDQVIQSLCFPHELEARLKVLRQASESAIQEMGTNILYLAVGFLEWYESPHSNTKRIAPLVLIPVRLRRGQLNPKSQIYEYTVGYSDEGLVSNISLREKLRVDFGMALPGLDENTVPEDYLCDVGRLIKDLKPRWRVRRYISLALFNFSKLLMYLDLDPETWPAESPITAHPVVAQVLSGLAEGAESQGSSVSLVGFGEEYPIDTVPDIHVRYPLIDDADSSQHSALIDAVDGKNLVIEGPPGTGKSQTITNLIAAAMAQGKTVLFVAEKLAALEVVHGRLAAAGLDGFCLELHSHKAQKRKLLDDIQVRIRQRQNYSDPNEIDTEIQLLEEYRLELADYAEKLNQPWKNTGRTLHEIFCAAVRHRNVITVHPEDFCPDGCDGDGYDQTTQRRHADCAHAYSKLYRFTINSLGHDASLQEHPWFGVQNGDLQVLDSNRVATSLGDWQVALQALEQQLEKIASMVGCTPAEVAGDVIESRALLDSLEAIPALEGNELLESLPRLRGTDLVEAMKWRDLFVEIQKALHDLQAEVPLGLLQDLSPADQLVRSSEVLEQLVDPQVALGRLAQAIRTLDALTAELSVLAKPLQGLASTLGGAAAQYFAISFNGLTEHKKAIELVALLKPRFWDQRDAVFENEELDRLLPRLRKQAGHLQTQEQKLRGIYALGSGLDRHKLCELGETLDAGGALHWFKSSWRVARKQLLAHAASPRVKLSELRDTLDDAVLYVDQRAKLDEDVDARELLGRLFRGYETDLDSLQTLRSWYKRVREEYGTGFGRRATIGEAIIQLPDRSAGAIRTLAQRQLPRQLGVISQKLDELKAVFRPAAGLHAPDTTLIGDDGVAPKLLQQVRRATQACLALAEDDTRTVAGLASLAKRLAELKKMIQSWKDGDLDRNLFHGSLRLELGPSTDNKQALLALNNTLSLAAALERGVTSPKLSDFVFKVPTSDTLDTLSDFVKTLRPALGDEARARAGFVNLVRLDTETWLSGPSWPLDRLLARNQRALENVDCLQVWLDYVRARNRLETSGLGRVAAAVESNQLPIAEVEDLCRAAAFDALAREALKENPELARFSGKSHSVLRQRFVQCDKSLKTLQQKKVARVIDQGAEPPVGSRGSRVSDLTEMALLEHECAKRRRHIPIRQLIKRAGSALVALKPCFMMSPMSVAQYLEPGSVAFDIVVMDEASQIKPQDAMGAVARGGQLVVVGDPKQLPPTNFFDRLADTEDDEEPSNVTEAESVLDAVWPLFERRLLRWHYRSQHQDLIAFSNYFFYDGDLVLFPSPHKDADGFGIHYRRIPRGCFVNRRNLEEARVIAGAVRDHFRHNSTETLGVACMNSEQRLQIERAVEALAKDDPLLQEAMDRDAKRQGALFIKNLENVQGDERDVMLISMTYGPSEPGGRVMQRFGPINSETGWRRLNVLFTRAKKRMHIFSSMDSGDIVVGRSSKRGVAALRNFLSYCETGLLAQTARQTGRAPDSDFEHAVIDALQREGFECVPQVGVAGFFIDIAVIDPGRPGSYLMGIECDGASYHSAKSTRDRDRLRQDVLERLGWRIRRIWSTDWFKNPRTALDPIVQELHALKSEIDVAPAAVGRGEGTDFVDQGSDMEVSQTEAFAYRQGSLRDKLTSFDQAVIRVERPGTPDHHRLLRPAMLEALLEFQPTSRAEFLERIPPYLREGTDSGEGRYLEQVFEIVNASLE